MDKRTKATIMQWGKLYEVATRMKKLKPWEYLWDLDVIGIQIGDDPKDTAFFSILGRGGTCFGISIYEGYESFNTFMMLAMQESLGLPTEYAMFNQNNLTCYWGNREELSKEQRAIIKELGYKYRGKDNWLYFLSYEAGYFPYNLNQEEVLRFTQHLEDLEFALSYYVNQNVQVDFEEGNMFSFVFSEDRNTWHFGTKPLPFSSYVIGSLQMEDEELIQDLQQVPRGNLVLDMDLFPTGFRVKNEKYQKPLNPTMILIMERTKGMVIACEMCEPDEDPLVSLATELIDLIFQYGVPKAIYVSNVLLEAALDTICDFCRIKLKKVRRLRNVDEFKGEFFTNFPR